MSVPRLSRRGFLTGLSVMAVGGAAGYVVARSSFATDPGPKKVPQASGYVADTDAGQDRYLAAVSQIPFDGGLILLTEADGILQDGGVVLTRDADGVHGFTATCTHKGCSVNKVADGLIRCPCHGSQFDAATGVVRQAPASRPLPKIAVVVRDGDVFWKA